jgi:hypothetical protein
MSSQRAVEDEDEPRAPADPYSSRLPVGDVCSRPVSCPAAQPAATSAGPVRSGQRSTYPGGASDVRDSRIRVPGTGDSPAAGPVRQTDQAASLTNPQPMLVAMIQHHNAPQSASDPYLIFPRTQPRVTLANAWFDAPPAPTGSLATGMTSSGTTGAIKALARHLRRSGAARMCCRARTMSAGGLAAQTGAAAGGRVRAARFPRSGGG